MHTSVLEWVDSVVNKYTIANLKTLEVGSRNENGTVRRMFTGEYVGIDMREGPGVDEVMNAHVLDQHFEEGEFDTVVCTEMLEHDDEFWVSLQQMGYVLQPGGLLILTTRGNGFPEHGYPDDYFRFMPNSGEVLLRCAECQPIVTMVDPSPSDPGIFALGRRMNSAD